jgi:hypothetical protein
MGAVMLRRVQQAANPVARRAVRQAQRIQAWRRLAGPLVPMLVGETGVPWADPASQHKWDAAMDAYLREHMADPTTTVCLWEVGPGVGADGKLGLMTDISASEGGSGTKGITHERRNLTVPQRWWRRHPTRIGVNYAGGEYMGNGGNVQPSGVFSNLNTGALGTDYFLPRASGTMSTDAAFLAARGVRLVRLPIRWERMTASPGGALQATPVTELHAALDQFAAVGIQVILDCHNYANYWLGTDTTTRTLVVLARTGGSLTSAHLSDFWVRMDAEFGAHAAVHSYDLMNESSLGSMQSAVTINTNVADFESDTQSWTSSSGGTTVTRVTSPTNGSSAGALSLARTYGTGFSSVNMQEAAGTYNRPGQNIRISIYASNAGSGITWQARLLLNNAAITGTDIKTLTKGAFATYTFAIPAGFDLTNHTRIGLQIFANNADGGAHTHYIDDVQVITTETAAQIWQNIAADCADALHAEGSTRRVWLSGYGTSEGSLTTFHQSAGPYYTGGHTNYGYAVHNYHDANEAGSDSNWEFGRHSRDALSKGY